MRFRFAVCFVALAFIAACGSEGLQAVDPAPSATVPPTSEPTGKSSASADVVIAPTATPRVQVAGTVQSPTPAPTTTVTQQALVVGASIAGCELFPPDNPWRRNVSNDPVDPRSANYIRSISRGASFLHADFGSNPDYGIPITVVPRTQKKVPIRFTDYGNESDPGPYPVPLNARVEGGNDRHVLVVQRETCKLYEMFNARRTSTGWSASSGAVFDLRSNRLRPAGWTSADAAGLPMIPGLARYPETDAGVIRHALRFTAQFTQKGYVHPARHWASDSTDANLPPMGLRLRLKKSYSLSRFHGHSLVILKALRTYGMILADNGSSWYISGATDSRWNDDDLNQLKTVPGSAFEVVKHGTIRR